MWSVDVISERTPEDYTSIITCTIRKWHSFITNNETIKEFLVLGHESEVKATEIYEAPALFRVSKRDELMILAVLKNFRHEIRLQKIKNKQRKAQAAHKTAVQKKYGDWFEEPLPPTKNYRDNPNAEKENNWSTLESKS